MPATPYYLGCPVWASRRWVGSLFTRGARRDQFLRQYASVFHAVEGNSTFYGLPPRETIRRWMDSVDDRFRFVLKFPRAISHERRLRGADRETVAFLEVLEMLNEARCLGPSFLQLPRGFGPRQLDDLAAYLDQLPRRFPYAVEVRHPGFFDGGRNERALDDLLASLHIDRVILDARALFSAPPSDASERASQARKPNCPVHKKAVGRHPIVRLVGRNDVCRNLPWVREWAPVIAGWIISGLTPFVFAHTPDEAHAPTLARMFHQELMKRTQRVEPLPPWPGEREAGGRKQLSLF